MRGHSNHSAVAGRGPWKSVRPQGARGTIIRLVAAVLEGQIGFPGCLRSAALLRRAAQNLINAEANGLLGLRRCGARLLRQP